MACPLFLPALPPGDLHAGECAGAAGRPIPMETLRRCCNIGYARGECERAAGLDADANRFLVKSDSGGSIEVAWSTERDHHPVAVGILHLTPGAAASQIPLERQAAACAETYLRHRLQHNRS